jgi:hypothetical protein
MRARFTLCGCIVDFDLVNDQGVVRSIRRVSHKDNPICPVRLKRVQGPGLELLQRYLNLDPLACCEIFDKASQFQRFREFPIRVGELNEGQVTGGKALL